MAYKIIPIAQRQDGSLSVDLRNIRIRQGEYDLYQLSYVSNVDYSDYEPQVFLEVSFRRKDGQQTGYIPLTNISENRYYLNLKSRWFTNIAGNLYITIRAKQISSTNVEMILKTNSISIPIEATTDFNPIEDVIPTGFEQYKIEVQDKFNEVHDRIDDIENDVGLLGVKKLDKDFRHYDQLNLNTLNGQEKIIVDDKTGKASVVAFDEVINKVETVNGVQPDENRNVQIDADDIETVYGNTVNEELTNIHSSLDRAVYTDGLNNLQDISGVPINPVTEAVYVKTTKSNVQEQLNEIVDEIRYVHLFKGVFTDEQSLLAVWPNGNVYENGIWVILLDTDTVWIYDNDVEIWKDTGNILSDVFSVNNKFPDETGNILITGSDIDSTVGINGEATTKTITQHIQDLYNQAKSLQTSISVETQNRIDADNTLSTRINGVDNRLTTLDGEVGLLENRVEKLEEDFKTLKDDLVNDYVDLQSDQTIVGQKIFEKPIKLSTSTGANVDTITNTDDGLSISSSSGKTLLDINETLETVTAFSKPLAFEEDVAQDLNSLKTTITNETNTKLLDYVKIENIVDNLTSTETDKPLSANQGKVLDDKITDLKNNVDSIDVPTKTSDLTNDGEDGSSPYATEQYVNTNGGKIDVIKVDGVVQSIVNKEVDITLANRFNAKLDKVSTTGSTKVYGIDASGSQVMYDVSKTASGTTIVQRNNGQITVPDTPSSETDATSKKYVDNSIASLTGQNEYVGSYTGTSYTASNIQTELTNFVQSLESRAPRGGDLINIVNSGNGVDYSGQQWIYDDKSSTWKFYLTFDVHDVIDNLTSYSTNDGLAANQGRVLKGLIDDLQNQVNTVGGKVDDITIPAKTSDLENDGEDGTNPFITSEVNDLVNYYTDDEIDAMLDEYVLKTSIVNNLTTTSSGNVLDARQGKALNDLITSTNNNLNTTNQNLSALTTRVGEAEDDIASNMADIASNSQSISTLNGQVSTLQTNLTSLTSRVSANETAINNINAKFDLYFPLAGNKTIEGTVYLAEGVSLRSFSSGTSSHYALLSQDSSFTSLGNTVRDLWMAGNNTRPMYTTINESGSQVNKRLALLEDVSSQISTHNSSSTAHSNLFTAVNNEIDRVEGLIPTTTNELTNNSGFITNTVDNLTNYYKKTETYTQDEVNQLIANVKQFKAEIVNSLPSTGVSGTIYLVPKSTSGTNNVYDEYMWINNKWENIGATTVDLSDYYTKSQTYSRTEINNFLNAKANASALTTTNNNVTNLTTRVSTLESEMDTAQSDITTIKSNYLNKHGDVVDGNIILGYGSAGKISVGTNSSNSTYLELLNYNSSSGAMLIGAGTRTENGTTKYGPSEFRFVGDGAITRYYSTAGVSATVLDTKNFTDHFTIPTNNNQLTNGAGYITSDGTSASSNKLNERDNRAVTTAPNGYMSTYAKSVLSEFKGSSVTGLTGVFSSVLTVTPWSDSSGGRPHQLAFNDDGNVYHRFATADATWGSWGQLAKTGNIGNGTLTIQNNGTNVATFSANQSGNTTANITVPTVNNGTLTIQKNGTNVATFGANSSSNVTANISVPVNRDYISSNINCTTEAGYGTIGTSETTIKTFSSGAYGFFVSFCLNTYNTGTTGTDIFVRYGSTSGEACGGRTSASSYAPTSSTTTSQMLTSTNSRHTCKTISFVVPPQTTVYVRGIATTSMPYTYYTCRGYWYGI